MRTMSNAVNLHVLSDLREVLRFWRDCSVEFCYWDTPGCNLGPKHGCWVNDGGCTNLHSTPGGAVTLLTKLLRVKKSTIAYTTVPHVHCLWASMDMSGGGGEE